MTPNQSFLAAIIAAILSSGAWPVFGPKVVGWKNRKKNEQDRHREVERDQWMRDSKDAYQRVQVECADCHEELEKLKADHARQLKALRRDLADVRDALFTRLDAFDEVLPYVQGMPEEKVRELRAANRAVRSAVYRGA